MGEESTSEEAYEQALADDVDWELLPDGTPTRGTGNTRRGGRAWGRP